MANQTSALRIRQGLYTDIPLIQELGSRIWPPTYSDILSSEQIDYMLAMMYSAESLKNQMDCGHEFLIISELEMHIGFASFSEIENNIYKLHKIYVLIEQQGKGRGSFVITEILNTVEKRGAIALRLNVNRHNSARTFYEKLGFNTIGEEDIDIGNGYLMNDYVMEKRLGADA